jgi:hypothetical protein
MRKLLKILHTLGSVGFCGALAALLVIHASLPSPDDLERFAVLRTTMGTIARWMLLPSMGLVVVSGLFALGANPAFHSAGWVWIKLLSGILVFEGTLFSVQGPMERAARDARAGLAGEIDAVALAAPLHAEWVSLWIILMVGIANVVLGVWRPRTPLNPRPAPPAESPPG